MFQVKAFFCSACSPVKNPFKLLIKKINASYTTSHSIYLSCIESVYFILEASEHIKGSTAVQRMNKRAMLLTICLTALSRSFLPDSISKSPTIHMDTALIPPSSMKEKFKLQHSYIYIYLSFYRWHYYNCNHKQIHCSRCYSSQHSGQ